MQLLHSLPPPPPLLRPEVRSYLPYIALLDARLVVPLVAQSVVILVEQLLVLQAGLLAVPLIVKLAARVVVQWQVIVLLIAVQFVV